jgi:Zn-dependent peptidase ImmA (M78 family)
MIEKLDNKSFNLFGEKYKIHFVDKIVCDDEPDKYEVYGLSHRGGKNCIKVARTINNEEISEDVKELTLYHELLHAICDAGQYAPVSKDEPFIEWAAKCIFNLKKQGIL